MMTPPKITLVYGSVRQQRVGIRVAQYFQRCCEEKGWDTALIDPMALDLPLLDLRFGDYAAAEKELPHAYEEAHKRIQESDGIYVISAEYNHNIPPALKNFLDHLSMGDLSQKMLGMITYSVSPFAGVRAAPALRETLCTLGAVVYPAPFSIGLVDKEFPAEMTTPGEKTVKRATTFLEETAWLMEALRLAQKNC